MYDDLYCFIDLVPQYISIEWLPLYAALLKLNVVSVLGDLYAKKRYLNINAKDIICEKI